MILYCPYSSRSISYSRSRTHLFFGECNIKCWNQGLRKPEGEHQLRASHQKLRNQTLEETRDTLILNHAANNLESALWVIEISVLDTSLDYIERSRDEERCGSTSNRRDEVLEPGRLVIIAKPEEVFLSEC